MKLSREELIRYSRQLSLKDFGPEAQLKLKDSKVLVIGAGGLGCPALLYLASSGVGTIGIVDYDTVAIHNLPRQVIYEEKDVGKKKAGAAAAHLLRRNSTVAINAIDEKLTPQLAEQILPAYDIIIDCSDNFETRYIINDACVLLGKPFVYGSIFRFEGQVSLFNALKDQGGWGPTYRCLFPAPPEPGTAASCEEAGVIAFLPGLIGTLQAAEAIKWMTGIGESLSGRLLTLNSLDLSFEILEVERHEHMWASLLRDKVTLQS